MTKQFDTLGQAKRAAQAMRGTAPAIFIAPTDCYTWAVSDTAPERAIVACYADGRNIFDSYWRNEIRAAR